MALQILNFTVGSAATVHLGMIMPLSTITFSVGGTASGNFVSIGLGSTVSVSNGFAVTPGVPHTFSLPASSQAADLWAIASAANMQLSVVITTTA